MRQVKKILLVVGVAAGVASAMPFALAQSDEFTPERVFGYGDPADYNTPGINVPDERGCVKWCFRDDSPCDPPRYKRADNRCRNVD